MALEDSIKKTFGELTFAMLANGAQMEMAVAKIKELEGQLAVATKSSDETKTPETPVDETAVRAIRRPK